MKHGDKTRLGYVNITVPQDLSIMIQEFVLIYVLQLWEEMDLFQIVECVIGPVLHQALTEMFKITEAANLYVHFHLKNIMVTKQLGCVYLIAQLTPNIITHMIPIKYVELIVQVLG